jgi:N-acetylmuramoyl-L-alanine amidase
MKILRHRLHSDNGQPLPFVRSPNTGGPLESEYLIIHYTAGGSAHSSIDWLVNPAAKASAHLVIGRDGRITQLVPFDRVAWHAGTSSWAGRDGLNRFSLGIELDNAGPLNRVGGVWRAWFGRDYPDAEVIEATHKLETRPRGWHVFTEAQIAVCLEASLLLMQKYGLKDVLGHDDVSPGRKLDPGPAFPMRSFKARLLGRREDESVHSRTTTQLNIRSGPGTQHPTLQGSPLPEDTVVLVLEEQGSWRLVDVLDVVNGLMDLQGWVHGRYLGPR